jgi:ATP/maltotriose-dependent transcriptional regulator MalT/tRNA A-37 threonylcarbamoyl transferase component Bud32
VFAAGTTLGPQARYRIERRLGRGGFGEAYLAYDIQLDRPCVVKRLILDPTWSPEDQQRVLRNFQREARLLATLNTPGHPSIPEIYDYLAESHSLVIKYIAGQSLGRLLDQQPSPLPVDQALRYVRDICSALVYMHTRTPEPVLHKDIKPDNILLDAAGRIWLIDFGLARTTPMLAPSIAVEDSQIAGTLGFTPPEQWQGAAEPRSDVYALGATLHMLLTNYQPARSELAAMMQGLGAGLPPARQLNPAVSPAAESLIQRALALHVTDRPTAQEFLDELEAMLARPAIPPPPEPRRPPAVTAFVGRQAELAYFADRLAAERLAVITGLAGVGKTTLASMLVERVGVPSRTFWHTFHKNEGVDVVVWDLAAFLAREGQDDLWRMLHSSQQASDQRPPELLFDYLLQLIRGRRYLLCLDDFHFVDDDPRLSQLARRLHAAVQAGEMSLIMVSRHVPAWVQPGEFAPLAGLGEADVCRLLASRGVTLADDLVTELAARTEGNAQFLTLAIEALRRADDPAGLVARLAAAESIEGYLLAEVDAGLSADERAVMSAVAVLQGYSGTREAIEALLERSGLPRLLSTLSRCHMLSVREGEVERQYGQHAIVQTFYYDQLSQLERQTLHRRAGQYYETAEPDVLMAATHFARAGEHARAAALATADVWSIINRGQARALRLLLEEIPLERIDLSLRAAVCTARGEVYALQGDFAAARAEFQQALEHGALLEAGPAQIEAQARRRRLLALVGERTGAYAQAEADCRNGLLLTAALGLPNVEAARLHAQLANVLMRRGDFAGAERACHDGLAALPPEPPATRERVTLLQRLATLDGQRGRYADAIRGLEQSLALARQTGDQVLTAAVLHNLGNYLNYVGQSDHALTCYQESLQLKEHVGDVDGRAWTILNMGQVYLAGGDHDTALRCFLECRDLSVRLNLPDRLALATLNIGCLRHEQGLLDEAETHFLEALVIYRSLDDANNLSHCLYRLGDVTLAQGNASAALDYGKQALALARRVGSAVFESCALRVIGEALLAQGRLAEAAAHLEQARRIQDRIGDPYDQALILKALAYLALARGDRALTVSYARAALALARQQNAPHLVAALEPLCDTSEDSASYQRDETHEHGS